MLHRIIDVHGVDRGAYQLRVLKGESHRQVMAVQLDPQLTAGIVWDIPGIAQPCSQAVQMPYMLCPPVRIIGAGQPSLQHGTVHQFPYRAVADVSVPSDRHQVRQRGLRGLEGWALAAA